MIEPKHRDFIELATVTTTNWEPDETAKMHNAMRSKTAPIGANAVVILHSGVDDNDMMWTTGVAIRFAK